MQLVIAGIKRRPTKPFNAVAFDRLSVLFGYGNAHYRLFRRRINYGEKGRVYSLPLFEKFRKITAFFKP